MKEPINTAEKPVVDKFIKIVSGAINGSLSAITSKSVELSVTSVFECDAIGLCEGFLKEIAATGKEEKTGCDIGFLFKTMDITMLADLMLAGEGTGSPTLDPDMKDAVKELVSQLAGSLNVPVQEGIGKQFAVKIDDVVQNSSTDIHMVQAYTAADVKCTMPGKTFEFRFFMEKDLSSYLFNTPISKEGNESSEVGSVSSITGTQNLDLLLDVEIPVSVRMGSAKLFLKDILGLGPGNIVELEQNADDAIDLVVNDKVIARGEVVIVDGYFGFRIKEILSKIERIKKLKD